MTLRTASKIALRETRSSMAKFLFVVIAVAAGVGCVSGVRGFSNSFRSMLMREARTLMAGDMSARMFVLPNDDQEKILDSLAARGVERTQITETFSMAAPVVESAPDGAGQAAPPLLVSIKAVDPLKYPYYGKVKLNPEGNLSEALKADTVAVAEDLLVRLKMKLGDSIKVGGAQFKIVSLVVSEPDRMSGSMNIGLRLMMSREAIERTGLIKPGSRAAQRFLFKLAVTAPPVEDVRKELKKAFPDALVADFRQTHPIITGGLDRSTVFLSLVSLIALIVGALGVGMAMHAHLAQRMDNIAVMKSLGATSNQIMRIYLIQTLMLGFAGGIAGVIVGIGIQNTLPILIERIFKLSLGASWSPVAALQGIAIGVLTTLLFTLPPLLAIRRVRPALILRRDTAEVKRNWRERLSQSRSALVAVGVILLGLGGIAWWLSESARLGAYFIAGLTASVAALSFVAWALLRTVRAILDRWRLPSSVRQGMGNIYRQGSQAQAILVALGLGVMFTLTVYLVQNSLIKQIVKTAPPGMPNVYMIDITQAQAPGILAMLKGTKGIEGSPELVPSTPARLTAINGVPLKDLKLQGWARRFLQTRSVMFEAEKPDMTKVLEGAWWTRANKENVVSIAEDAAKTLNLKPGAKLEFLASGRTIVAEVRAVHVTEAIRVSAANEFIFNPEALAGLPTMYYGGVRMQPADVANLQRTAYEKFPTVTVINLADALQLIQEVVDQIAVVIRFLSAFAILAGIIILASAVAGTRFRRVREVVILKTLGATRQHIAKIFSVEFLTLGAVAGLLGSLMASIFSSLMLTRFLDATFQFDPIAALSATVITAFLANASGWMASWRILGQKPLEVLRED